MRTLQSTVTETPASHPDEGYFPAGRSTLRRVHGERAVGVLYGQRALMLGALEPLAYAGTSLHTNGKRAPFQRLSHTATVFEHIFFGTKAEANRALAAVRRQHDEVKGKLPEAVGPHPAGTAYSAYDPELMFWGVVAPMVDSAAAVYEALVRPLTDEERESLWQDYLLFGELFGMPRSAAPDSFAEFAAAWKERLTSDCAFLSEEAHRAGYHAGLSIPLPPVSIATRPLLNLLLVGTLPDEVREVYGIAWNAPRAAAFRSTAAALRASRPFSPRRLRRGECKPLFDAVAKTERGRLRRGKVSPMYPDHATGK